METLALLGFTEVGIAGGSIAASMQSAAMGGAGAAALAGPIAGIVVGATVVIAASAAGGAVLTEYVDAQKHTLGDSTGLTSADTHALVWHNWGRIGIRGFGSRDDANECMRGGRRIRRILVSLNTESEVYDRTVPWKELKHRGENPKCDDDMRDALRKEVLSVK
jgi:hypothetical protein